MVIVKSKGIFPRQNLTFLSDEVRKELIHEELVYKLAKELLKNCKIPIPLREGDNLIYEIDVHLSSRKESQQIYRDQEELKIYKEICGHYQDIVDKRIEENTIEKLLGN